jgi:hypothetical protein
MTAYIFKTVLCAALFLAFYLLVLEREKMHRFNRFYLLFALLLSFCVPLVPLQVSEEFLPADTTTQFIPSDLQIADMNNPLPAARIDDRPLNPVLLCYLAGTLFLLLRFVRNLVSIYHKARTNPSIEYAGARLVLLPGAASPHSFLKYIFINRHDYESARIENEILSHELAHVRQKHSLDILLLEIIFIFAWVNPVIFLFIKAVQVNHEYLADDAVVCSLGNKADYQLLLINKITESNRLLLSSQFNYLITKKRLLMMTKNTTPAIALLKQATLIPFIVCMVFLFSSRTAAQEKTEKTEKETSKETKPATSPKTDTIPPEKKKYDQPSRLLFMSAGSTKEGVSEVLMKEYETIVKKYKTTDDLSWGKKANVSQPDRDRLEEIFLQMNDAQQLKQHIVFLRPTAPLPKITPTAKQFGAYKNAAIYGVWLDDKKVNNQVLSKYKHSDFSHVFVSKLHGGAKKNVKYHYQVDLSTNGHFEAYNKKVRENNKNRMTFRDFSPSHEWMIQARQ